MTISIRHSFNLKFQPSSFSVILIYNYVILIYITQIQNIPIYKRYWNRPISALQRFGNVLSCKSTVCVKKHMGHLLKSAPHGDFFYVAMLGYVSKMFSQLSGRIFLMLNSSYLRSVQVYIRARLITHSILY